MQREARERARMQSGMANKTEQASTTTTRANSISSEVEATKDHDKEKDKDKEDEREKKGGAWNWRWRWGKDKDKKDSKDGSNKDASKDPAPKSTPRTMLVARRSLTVCASCVVCRVSCSGANVECS
jgi:hypothetical protein